MTNRACVVGMVLFAGMSPAALADASLASTAFSTAGRVEFSQGGQLTIGNDIFGITAPDYSRQIENTDVGMNVELYAMGQRTSWKGRYIAIEKFLEPQGDGSFTVTWALDLKPCGQPAIANLCIEVPPESFDELPPQPVRRPDADGVFRLNGLFGGMELSVAGSDGQWFFEDFRKAAWSGRFRFRCSVPYNGLAPWKGRLSMNFKGTAVRHPAFRVLDLSSAANTGLTDETDGDRKGGWTDQGRNDLSPLAKGADLLSRFVPLKVTPRAIVLAGGDRTYFPSASAEIPVGFAVRRLDFLHAVAWAGNPGSVAFRYRVRYADGSVSEIPLVTGEDVNNWHGVVEPTRGYVAWEGANSASSLSLHHSRWVNPTPEKAIAGLTVLGNPTGGAVPMVLGVTALDAAKLTDRQFRALENLFVNKPRNDVDLSGWYPCGLPWGGAGKTIAAGTALDASATLASSPSAFDRHVCGDYGRVIAVGDHFEFEQRPGMHIPFWGVNFASNSSSPPKDLAQGIVDNLKRQGVNMVRFHMFGGMPGRQMTEDGYLLPERQDRMDYFVSVLKKSGIYVYIDWEDTLNFPDLADKWPFRKGVKWASIFMPDFRKRERDYARALFGHKNPYTGLSYAEDPAVAFIEILNEADLCTVINANPRNALDPQFYAELDRQWKEWNVAHGKTDVKSIADEVGNPDRLRFATSVQRAYQKTQREFLREELGFRGLVTGNNIVQHAYAVTAINDGMDFAGLHGYVGHIPGYYNTPYDNTSVVRTVSPGVPFFGQTWERPANLPYCFGEWNFCYPNDYRSEGLPFTTAMMAFQGWSISLFYAFTGPMNWGEWEHFHAKGIEGIFAHGAGMDPSTWGLTVPCAIAFRRGDIRPSKNVIMVRHTQDELLNMSNPFQMRQMALSWMFMLGRVYTEVADEPDLTHWPMKRESGLGEWDEIKSVATNLGIDGVKDGYLVSDTGEMKKFIGDGLFLVDTPRSKFAVGNLSSMGRDGRVLSGVTVKSPETFAALTLTSLDAEPTPIESAKRVLVCFVGNSRNEAAVIRGRTIVDPGWEKSRTVLAEPLEATLAFPHAKGPFRVYKLSTRTGERQGEIPVNADGSFTIPKSAHTIYFEVVSAAITLDCAYSGGNVKVLSLDEESGIVRIAPDLRDTEGHWFHFDFTVRGAAGRTLKFRFPQDGNPYLSSLGPAICKDGIHWAWLNADGKRHEPGDAFDYTFGKSDNVVRFAVSMPYVQKDWDAFTAKWRGSPEVKFDVLCKSQSGRRDVELLRVPARGRVDWLFVFTARHHACETTGNPPMEGVLAELMSDSPESRWAREHADVLFVPFMDKDGVEEGDQGKNRRPWDYNRDYARGRYSSVRALKDLIVRESAGKKIVFFDFHSPYVRSFKDCPEQDQVFTFGTMYKELADNWERFRENWKAAQAGGKLCYSGLYDIPAKKGYWNVIKAAWDSGLLGSDPWVRTLPNAKLATCCEFGYSLCGGVNSREAMRELGANLLKATLRTVSRNDDEN